MDGRLINQSNYAIGRRKAAILTEVECAQFELLHKVMVDLGSETI